MSHWSGGKTTTTCVVAQIMSLPQEHEEAIAVIDGGSRSVGSFYQLVEEEDLRERVEAVL